jgi:endo-1,4-beta-xylanase
MIKRMTLFVTLLLFLGACAQLNPNEASELEELAAGTPIVGNTYQAFQYRDNAVRVEKLTVTGQVFTKSWRFTSLQTFTNPYDAQLSASSIIPIQKDDVLLVRFYARAVGASQKAQTEFLLEEGAPNYTKSLSVGVELGKEWKLFQVPFKAHRDFAVGEAFAHFRLGYTGQSFELGGIILSSYQKTRTVSSIKSIGFNYLGREANAAWRQTANTRIDQLRKGNLTVNVVDASGKAVSGATVKVEMQRHAFPFGSAVDAERLFANTTYRDKSVQLFNRVVLENDLKWPFWECCRRDQTPNLALQALDFYKSKNISVRGHNFIWPCDADYCLPEDVVSYLQASNLPALRNRIDSHLVELTSATKGKIVEWDVVNEPSANKRVFNVMGEDEMASWYKRVKQLEPTAKLFLNDYGNLGEGALDVEYKRIIRRMLALGAPLEGVGLQAHFGWDLTPPEELYSRLSSFGQFGLPLAITEFDVNVTDEQLQADYLRDALTVAFSNSKVSSFLMWGFWEGQHWLPDAALYRQDWSIKPNGKVWNDLIFKQWWTNVSGSSSSQGTYSTRGFLGDYKITVTKNGKTITQNITLTKAGTTRTVTLR